MAGRRRPKTPLFHVGSTEPEAKRKRLANRRSAGTITGMATEELREFATSLLDDLCASHPTGYRPKLIWKRLRVTAGTAYYSTGTIALSAIVLHDEARLSVTLRHEYAHLLAFARHGRKGAGHGLAWRTAMRDLGLEPEVRHKYEVQRNKPRQEVEYSCRRCGKSIFRKRRLPARRRYVHANCGGALKLQTVRAITGKERDT